jgi:hypothetical protein
MLLDPLTSSIVTGVLVSLFAGVVLALLRRRWQNVDRKRLVKEKAEIEQKALDKIKDKDHAEIVKSIWRINKTILIMAKIIDDQTEKAHADLNSSLEDIATELLRESDKS